MLSLSIVVVLALVACTQAYSTGAPLLRLDKMMDSMCSIGNLRPGHRSASGVLNMPRFEPAPFKLRVENPHLEYKPGTKVRVTLTALAGKTFKGFFITGDGEDAQGGFEGTFEAALGTQAKPTRFCVSGITHTSSAPKTSVSILWTPPANYTHGRVMFKATVVENFETFYTGVLSSVVNAIGSVDTRTVYKQKEFRRMMGAAAANRGGGMLGGMNMGDLMSNMNKMLGSMGGTAGGMNGGGMGGGQAPARNPMGQANPMGAFFQNLG